MKKLPVSATKTFLRLIEGLPSGEARTIDNAPGTFMAVHIDHLRTFPAGSFYAVAHRYEQNGDLVPDPDVEFLVTDDPLRAGGKAVYPTAIDQALGYRRYVELGDDDRPARLDRAGQADLAAFCATWMHNIRDQQRL
jgi:hypothetical protein